ncbi:MAG: TonB-dependent receptor plug domain-containing protein [Vicinamibacterales bacterium]
MRRVLIAVVVMCLSSTVGFAQQQGTLSGAVLDPLGARVPGASVTLLRNGQEVGQATSGTDGSYSFAALTPDRYQVLAAANGFEAQTSAPVFVDAGGARVDVTLQVGSVTQGVVVTASASEIQQSQTGAPVTVIDGALIESLNKPEVTEALRLIPGAQIHQVGARGGQTSLFIRGGNSNFTKVLIDGIPANDIGGAFDFAHIGVAGVERVEVLRQANSVIYGADALTGVVNIETRRGSTRVPELAYAIDGGNLGTFRNGVSGGGAVGRFDYFSEFTYMTTDNALPNNGFENRTYAGRFGVQAGRFTDISGVVRIVRGETGLPNSFSFFDLADDSSQASKQAYAGVTANSQWTDRLQTTLRFGSSDQTTNYVNPTPTGEAFDPFGFGANYLGQRVTITGANGYSTTGRAILDFGGEFPSTFDSRTTRRTFWGQASYNPVSDLQVSVGGRIDREQGYGDPDGDPTTTRHNGGLFVEGRGSIGMRTFVSAGLGYERNESFDPAVTPRVSVATYLRTPVTGMLGDTKLSFNAGTGIKAPAVFQVDSSLYGLLQGVPGAPVVSPISPERGTSIDIGVEQGLWDGHARVRLAYFRNTYEDLIEFVSQNALPQAGVPVEVAQQTAFGAYVNSQSYEAQGLEASGELRVANNLRVMASYTFLDAEVTESLSSGALSPAFNPAFPEIPIGAFSPLAGERPFRRPAHSGTLLVSYDSGPANVTVSAFFSGRRDDSTFLSDEFFGNSMLLPNQGLAAAYQKIDLSASYEVGRRLRPYISIENLFDKEYEAGFGFPSLPRTARVGVAVMLGGD